MTPRRPRGPAPVPHTVPGQQRTPEVAQPKSGFAPGSPANGPQAPPVYRPETSQIAQRQKAPTATSPRTANAPPVYRPQPEGMRRPSLSVQRMPAAQNAQTTRAPRPPAVQARMAASVVQRTVWEWTGRFWMAVRTEGSPTAQPPGPGSFIGHRISTGNEDPWAVMPQAVLVQHVAEERDAAWRSMTRRPLYAEAFGDTINPGGCHAEEEILAQLTGKRAAHQDKATTKLWKGRGEKVTSDGALKLELNAWPCRGSGDPNCHAKLSQFASTNGITVTVEVVGDSGGYESGHQSDPNWVAGATKVTYAGTTVTYTK